MRLSVHLMVLNGRPFLERLLGPLRGIVDEVCFVDTGSTDGTPDAIAALAASLGMSCSGVAVSPVSRSDLYFRDEPSSFRLRFQSIFTGQSVLRDWSAARNLGLDLCRGKYVMKLDVDDEILTPGAICPVLDELDRLFDIDCVMSPYEVMFGSPKISTTHHVEMYTRFWRRLPAIRFCEVCHENVDWWRKPDGSNWVMTNDAFLVRDHRDNVAGTRVPDRNFKVLLREYERIEAAGERPTAYHVLYLAQEGAGVAPRFSLDIMEKWLSGLSFYPQDQGWLHIVAGQCWQSLGAIQQACESYTRAEKLGFARAGLLCAFAELEFGAEPFESIEPRLRKSLVENEQHYYPRGASSPELTRARWLLGEGQP